MVVVVAVAAVVLLVAVVLLTVGVAVGPLLLLLPRLSSSLSYPSSVEDISLNDPESSSCEALSFVSVTMKVFAIRK